MVQKMKYPKPNYTQIPNGLLDDDMRNMKDAELRVVLALCRQTFGYHRDRVRYSLTKLEEATGLSRNGVLMGIEAAEKSGRIIGNRGAGVTEWVVNVDDYLVNVVNQTSEPSEPPSIKESIKESSLNITTDSTFSEPIYEDCNDDGEPIKKKKVKITKTYPFHGYWHNRVWTEVTGMPAVPGSQIDKVITALDALQPKFKTEQDLVAYLQKYFSHWKTRKGKDGSFYSPANAAWLYDMAVAGVPLPEDKKAEIDARKPDPDCPLCHGLGRVRVERDVRDPLFGKLEDCECTRRSNARE